MRTESVKKSTKKRSRKGKTRRERPRRNGSRSEKRRRNDGKIAKSSRLNKLLKKWNIKRLISHRMVYRIRRSVEITLNHESIMRMLCQRKVDARTTSLMKQITMISTQLSRLILFSKLRIKNLS